MKEFFNITAPYTFEWNDLRCIATLVNVFLIITFGFSVSWIGLLIAAFGLVKDFTTDKRINSIIMHISNVILNSYLLFVFYCSK